jgi:predicted nucleotidyltransferase
MDLAHPIEALITGAQGRVLAVLAETTSELSIRTIARLSNVSVAQAARVLPRLADLGVVERRDVPPSSLFRLVPEHVSVRALLQLARARDDIIKEMRRAAATMAVVPVSIIVFGSSARGEAGAASDIDVVFVRPADVDADDDRWAGAVEQWRATVRRASGNPVEVLEVGAHEVASRLSGRREVWRDIRREGIVVHGLSLADLSEPTLA